MHLDEHPVVQLRSQVVAELRYVARLQHERQQVVPVRHAQPVRSHQAMLPHAELESPVLGAVVVSRQVPRDRHALAVPEYLVDILSSDGLVHDLGESVVGYAQDVLEEHSMRLHVRALCSDARGPTSAVFQS